MIAEQTVLKGSLEHTQQVKQRCRGKVSEQKKARVCTEWRKARSRVAARSRREKESQLFRDIAALLPLTPNVEAQLDKASVIRLTIAYLRLRALLDTPASSSVPAPALHLSSRGGEPEGVEERWFNNQTPGGFLLIVSLNGKIIFTTKDVASHTGISQMDLIGRSLFDFMHPCDQKELKEILTKLIGSQGQQKCDIFLRIKGATNHKLTPWKVIHCTGVRKSSHTPGCSCLLLLCRSLPVQDVIEREAHLNFKAFLSTHSPDMKFTYCHSGVLELTGFSDTELCGQSVYQYYHPSDCQHVRQAHLCLLAKGQVCTGKYRLLQKHGGYVWVETDATVVYNIRTGKPESVVCINYILSGAEMADVVFSLEQIKRPLKPHDTPQSKICTSITPFTATPSTTDERKSSVPPPCGRDGAANGHSEITPRSPACNSLTCDICALDLDSLAPYIPMDEEDFQLTPMLDGTVGSSGLTLDPEWRLHLDTAKSFLPTLQNPDSYFSLTDRASKDLPGITPSKQRHNPHTVNRKQQVEPNSLVPAFQNKTNQWRTGTAKASQGLGKHSDGSTACSCCQNSPRSVPWAPVYSKRPWRPQAPPFQHGTQYPAQRMAPAFAGLPVLSRLECEVNAPLGPTSHLLQGTELTTVLDQVAPAVPWY